MDSRKGDRAEKLRDLALVPRKVFCHMQQAFMLFLYKIKWRTESFLLTKPSREIAFCRQNAEQDKKRQGLSKFSSNFLHGFQNADHTEKVVII